LRLSQIETHTKIQKMESIVSVLSLARTSSLQAIPVDGNCTDMNGSQPFYKDCEDQNLICYDIWDIDTDSHVCLDGCATNPCDEVKTTCNPSTNADGYTCDCKPGWSNGANNQVSDCSLATCEDPLAPAVHPCFGRGLCTGFNPATPDNQWICTTPCTNTPCQNDAVCHSYSDFSDYRCDCKAGFTGRNCETSLSKCNNNGNGNPCENGGLCADTSDFSDYICECKNEYTGKTVRISWSVQQFLVKTTVFAITGMEMMVTVASAKAVGKARLVKTRIVAVGVLWVVWCWSVWARFFDNCEKTEVPQCLGLCYACLPENVYIVTLFVLKM